MNIELKEVTEKDFDFAFEAKKQAMGPHIVSKWGWDEDFQLSLHKKRWKEKPWFILSSDGEFISTVSIHHLKDYVRFGEFYLLDKFRNKGIGTQVLQQFLAECDITGKIVALEYLKWNPVGSLYKRNGFKVTHESDIHYFMVREPRSH